MEDAKASAVSQPPSRPPLALSHPGTPHGRRRRQAHVGVGGPDPRVSPGVIIKRKNVGIPCPLAVEAFAAHLSYICKYDDKYSR